MRITIFLDKKFASISTFLTKKFALNFKSLNHRIIRIDIQLILK